MSDHYKSHPSGIEAIEITQYESFLRGNILKYVLRAPYKGTEYEDLLKAAEYLNWEIERVEEERFLERERAKDFTNEWLAGGKRLAEHLDEVLKSRNEWDEDYYDYYRAGMTRTFNNVFKPGQSNYRIKPFDEVVFPDKCQECNGDCKVC